MTDILVERYTVISEVKFLDGFTLEANSNVRKVIESDEINGLLNVVYDSDINIKRIFWIENDNLELVSRDEEAWSDEEYQTEIKDKNENWFE